MKTPLTILDIFLIALSITGIVVSALDVHYMLGFMTMTVVAVLNAAFPSEYQRIRKPQETIRHEMTDPHAVNKNSQS